MATDLNDRGPSRTTDISRKNIEDLFNGEPDVDPELIAKAIDAFETAVREDERASIAKELGAMPGYNMANYDSGPMMVDVTDDENGGPGGGKYLEREEVLAKLKG